MHSEGYICVRVSLDSKGEHIIVLRFTNGFIEYLEYNVDAVLSEEEIKNILQKLLTDDDNLYLIRLTRIALGNNLIKKQLKARRNGIFDIDCIKWIKIVNKIEAEDLEIILSEGLEDI
jgi:hypothetical protein